MSSSYPGPERLQEAKDILLAVSEEELAIAAEEIRQEQIRKTQERMRHARTAGFRPVRKILQGLTEEN